MQGDADVIELLNEVLTSELTAINQYYVHYKMCENWGYKAMAEHAKEESMEEMHHADAIIDRVLFLDGVPNMQRLNSIQVGETVLEQLQLQYKVELAAVEMLNRGVALARDRADNGTRDVLEHILREEEESVDWHEAQLGIIDKIGEERYLAEKL